MPKRNVAIIIATLLLSLICYSKIPQNNYIRLYQRATAMLDARYVEKIDQRQLFQGAMNGMMATLDEHSVYMAPREYRGLDEVLNQEFGGLGIYIERIQESNEIRIITPALGSPALEEGLQAGDIITRIGDRLTADLTIEESQKLMKGPAGEDVDLTVRREGEDELLTFTVTRAIIQMASVRGYNRQADGQWKYRLSGENEGIIYMQLVDFAARSAEEIKAILGAAKASGSYRGIILDLRGNGGGLLNTAVDVCDLFVNQQNIVSVRFRHSQQDRSYEGTAEATIDATTPMVILIDENSASASEITTACLQDNERVVVIGQRSYGKGSVQDVEILQAGDEEHAIKFTIAHFWRPDGQNIHRREPIGQADTNAVWGVRPTEGYEVVLTTEQQAANQQDRLRRFVIQPQPNKTNDEPVAAPATSVEFDKEPIKPNVDPHLQKAIEYLNQRDFAA
ncbi:MAG: S41 family peptidase [Planctomycetaceae bacterium]|jgi:carboxyl-terminal processing protease|nr:S41 family peptidase [Planctomycetaceae bacterium]